MDTKSSVSENWNKSVETTLNLLVDKEASYQIITIYGATGTGKTELLRKVINEVEVLKSYDSVYVYDWDDGLDLDYGQFKRISKFKDEKNIEGEILFIIEDISDLTMTSQKGLLVSIEEQLSKNKKSRVLATSQRITNFLFESVETKKIELTSRSI
ncbi:NB-ARC domain-containing protein [Halobacteriovorax sp. XZX-3]|uniref:ATP-binding protein n=1 Tax=unclassified Halobacteriovorax TaxID=2639665 RepID=UPI003714376A